jgi:hypothetical protein
MKKLLLLFCTIPLFTLYSQAQTDAINIIPSGNVGISSTAPVSSLEVAGSYGQKVTALAANTVLNATHNTLVCDPTAGSFIVTLPTASGCTGRVYVIKRNAAVTANTVTIAGGATIDGAASFVLNSPNQVIEVFSDGSEWKTTVGGASGLTTLTAGNDIDFGTSSSPNSIDIEPVLNFVHTVSAPASNNLNLNAASTFATVVNYNNGTTGSTQTFRIGNGAGGSDVFYVYADGQAFTTNWWRSLGNTGWFSQTYGGGIWMDQANYVRVYNGKGFTVPGNVGIGTTSAAANLDIGGSSQSSPRIAVRTSGLPSIEFGHVNAAGYGSSIGALEPSGIPFLAFNAESEASGNTFKTRGIVGRVLSSNLAGGLLFSRVTNANAGGQSLTTDVSIDASGNLNIANLGTSSTVYTDGSRNLTTTAPTSGTLGYWTRSSPYLYNTTLTDNVGIGTSTPIARLDLGQAPSNKPLIHFNPGTTTGIDYTGYAHNDYLMGSYASGGYSQHYISFGYTADPGRKFHIGSAGSSTFDNTTTFVPAITVMSGGNVGISSITPVQKLEVNGRAILHNGGTTYNNAGSGELHVGYSLDSAGTVGETARLALQPYGHTGGPFVFYNRDDASSAYLDMRYGTTPSLFTLANNGNVGISSANPGQKLDVAGNIKLDDNLMVEGTSSARVYRNLATYSSNVGASPGVFIINTNQPFATDCMFRVKIEGYFYDASATFETTVGAYNYNGGSTFLNKGYTNIGAKNLPVRLGRNASGNVAIILGTDNATYEYPKISVTSYHQGYGGINEAYADGWTITRAADASALTLVTTVPDVTTLPTGSGNYIQNQFASPQTANHWINGNARIEGNTYIGPNANKYFYPAADRIIVAAESTTDVAEFASYGLFLPKTNAYNLYIGGGAQFAYSTAGYLDFRSEGGISTNSGTLNMYFKNTGNVGVGTTTASVRMHVNGNAFFDLPAGGAALENNLTIKKAGQSQVNFGSYPGAWTPSLQIQNNDNTRYVWISPLDNASGGNARLVTGGSNFDMYPGNTYTATFTTGGNVGIGSLSPTQKLTVAGNINKSGSWIAGDAVWGANNFEVHNSSWDGSTNGNYGGIIGGHMYSYGGIDIGTGGGNEAAGGQLVAATDIKSPIYYDRNDVNYYVDPNSNSIINTLRVAGGSPAAGKVLTSTDGAGNATWQYATNPWEYVGNDVRVVCNGGAADLIYEWGVTYNNQGTILRVTCNTWNVGYRVCSYPPYPTGDSEPFRWGGVCFIWNTTSTWDDACSRYYHSYYYQNDEGKYEMLGGNGCDQNPSVYRRKL